MKVYIVCNYDGEDTQILKVFNTEDKAEKYIKELILDDDSWFFFEDLCIKVRELE